MTAVAVVTGASRGLGAALANALIDRGHQVAVCATSVPSAPGAALRRAVDVRDTAALDEFASDVRAKLGPIDTWINNAAVLGPLGPVRTTAHSDWELAVAVNLLGAVAGTRAFLAPGRRSRAALLVNVASRAARRGAPGLAAYCATKAALLSLTESVAEEEEAGGLRVIAVIPPSIDTDMQHAILSTDPRVLPTALDARGRRESEEIVPPAVAAAMILEALQPDAAPPNGTVIDLAASL